MWCQQVKKCSNERERKSVYDRTPSSPGQVPGNDPLPLPQPRLPTYPSHMSVKPLPHFTHSWCQKLNHCLRGPTSQDPSNLRLASKGEGPPYYCPTEDEQSGWSACQGRAADLLIALQWSSRSARSQWISKGLGFPIYEVGMTTSTLKSSKGSPKDEKVPWKTSGQNTYQASVE